MQVLEANAKLLYLQYAKLDEEYGLVRHALAIYKLATKVVPDNDKLGIYKIHHERQNILVYPRQGNFTSAWSSTLLWLVLLNLNHRWML
jgi:hypothetical protein